MSKKINLIFAVSLLAIFLFSGIAFAQDQEALVGNTNTYSNSVSAFFGKLFSTLAITVTPSVAKAGDVLRYDYGIGVDKTKCSVANGGVHHIRFIIKDLNGKEWQSNTGTYSSTQGCPVAIIGTASYKLSGLSSGQYKIYYDIYDSSGKILTLSGSNSPTSLQVGGASPKPDCKDGQCSDWSSCKPDYSGAPTGHKERTCWYYEQTTNNCNTKSEFQTCTISQPKITCTYCDGTSYQYQGTSCPDLHCPTPQPTCTNDPYCLTENMFQCSGTATYQLCHKGSDGCFHWSANTNCPSGQECSYEHLQCEIPSPTPTCDNKCLKASIFECSGDDTYRICEADSEGCLNWKDYTCPTGQECSVKDATCVPLIPTIITCTHCDGTAYQYQGSVCPAKNCGSTGGGGISCPNCAGTNYTWYGSICPKLACGGVANNQTPETQCPADYSWCASQNGCLLNSIPCSGEVSNLQIIYEKYKYPIWIIIGIGLGALIAGTYLLTKGKPRRRRR
jgi:hypothetical protein